MKIKKWRCVLFKFKINYFLVLGLFLLIGCGDAKTKIDKIDIINNGGINADTNVDSKDIENFSYLYVDKNKNKNTLNYDDIFQITYIDDNGGLFVYRKSSDYSKSLDYFALDGSTATYSHTLDTFYKLETNLGEVIPLQNGKVAVLKHGSMSVLTIHDYTNRKKLSSLATSNFGKYISHDDNTIIFENKKVDISDTSGIKFIEDNIVKPVAEQLRDYFGHDKFEIIKTMSYDSGLLVRYEKNSSGDKSLIYFEKQNNKITYKNTLFSLLSPDHIVLYKIFELDNNRVAITFHNDGASALWVFELNSGNKINIGQDRFMLLDKNSGQQIGTNTLQFGDLYVNISDSYNPIITSINVDNLINLVDGDHKVFKPNDRYKLECIQVSQYPDEQDGYRWGYYRGHYTGVTGPNRKTWTRTASMLGTTSFSCTPSGHEREDMLVTVVPDDLKPSRSNLYVYAGDNQDINLGNSVYLTASKEYGFDTSMFRYAWVLDGEVISTDKSFTFTPENIGNYRFVLSAQDRNGNVAFDYVYVNVKESTIGSSTVEQQLKNYFENIDFEIYQTINNGNGLLIVHRNFDPTSRHSTLSYFSKFDGVIEFKRSLITSLKHLHVYLYKVFELDNNKIAVTVDAAGGDALWIYDLNNGERIAHDFASTFRTTILGDGKQISKNVIQLANANIDFTDPYNPIITHSGTPYIYAGDNQTIFIGDDIRISPSSTDNFIGEVQYKWQDYNGNIVSNNRDYHFNAIQKGTYKFILTATDNFGGVASDYIIITVVDNGNNDINQNSVDTYVYAGDNKSSMGTRVSLSASGMRGFTGDITYTWTDKNGVVLSRERSFTYSGESGKFFLKAEDSYGNVATDYVIVTFYD